ncbi:hypothetical protein AAG570_011897 [Ranatra chinensis]|uniref:LITAF domain-containing protein n=1 Tax=Ranatra chinensis TaxID=642074 RepID=A0ABD0YH83_9HEMI
MAPTKKSREATMNYNDHATLTKVSLGDGRVEPSAPPAPPELVHPPSYEEAVTQSSAACSVPQPQPGCYYPPQVIMSQPAPFVHQQPPYPQQQPVAYYGSNNTGGNTGPAPGMAQVRTLPVGPKPLKAVCPWCSKEIITRVEYKNKYAPHICCFVLLTSV